MRFRARLMGVEKDGGEGGVGVVIDGGRRSRCDEVLGIGDVD